jgi:hypothetical protein
MPKKRSKTPSEMTEEELVYKLLAPLLHTFDLSEVFYAGENPKTGKYIATLGGKKLTRLQAQNLQAEAKLLQQTELYKIITSTLKRNAEMVMFEKSQSFDDMKTGKAILYSVSMIQTIIHSLVNLQVDAI